MASASKSFRLAVPAASDPKCANDRGEAWLNVARVYHSEKRYDEAAAAYREFLGAYPNDVQARASLAELYLRANQRDSAMALYAAIPAQDRKSTRLNSSHSQISYAVFCLKKKKSPQPALQPPIRLPDHHALPCRPLTH